MDKQTSVATVQDRLQRSGTAPLDIRFSEHCTRCHRFCEDFQPAGPEDSDDSEDLYDKKYLDIASILCAESWRIRSFCMAGMGFQLSSAIFSRGSINLRLNRSIWNFISVSLPTTMKNPSLGHFRAARLSCGPS